MSRRYYSSTAIETTLSGAASNSTTSISVNALTGYPSSTPWTAVIDPDTASEEVVEVTAVAGTTLTVTRGVDGTSALSHTAGAKFLHGVSARDFDESNAHINDTTSSAHSQFALRSVETNARTDSYTLVLADAGKVVEMGKATAQTLTVPTNASVAFPVGTKVDVVQTGAGEVTVAGASGVTINSAGNKLKVNAQWQAATLIKRATNTWLLIGALKS